MKARGGCWASSSIACHLFFWEVMCYYTWIFSDDWTGWPLVPWDPSVPASQGWVYRSMSPDVAFPCECQKSKLRSLCLCCKLRTLSHHPAWNCTFLKELRGFQGRMQQNFRLAEYLWYTSHFLYVYFVCVCVCDALSALGHIWGWEKNLWESVLPSEFWGSNRGCLPLILTASTS